jgi:hypothetical protein
MMMSALEAKLRVYEQRLEDRNPTSANGAGAGSADFVIDMIGDALQDADLLEPEPDAPVNLKEIDVTLNVAAVHVEGGRLNFSVFGLAGDLGGSHRTDDTHAIKMSFQPEDFTRRSTAIDNTDVQPTGAVGTQNELSESFQILKMIVGTESSEVDAEPQKAVPQEATIVVNFVVQDDLSVSLVAAGQAETSTTHSVCLRFGRSSTEPS